MSKWTNCQVFLAGRLSWYTPMMKLNEVNLLDLTDRFVETAIKIIGNLNDVILHMISIIQ